MIPIRALLFPGLLLLLLCCGLQARMKPERVLVLANSQSKDSLKVALHYIQAREIPKENLVVIDMPLEQDISWKQFVEGIFNPLVEFLVKTGRIKAELSKQYDQVGRRHLAIFGHSIDCLVLSMDVPLRIKNDPSLIPSITPGHSKQEFMVNHASVDSELCLLTFPQAATVAYMPNPLFQKLNPGNFTLQQVVRVARLDGPDVQSVMKLVDNAILAEKTGLLGRAYIDYGLKYKRGDQWLKRTAAHIEAMGFPVTTEHTEKLIDYGQRFDAPALYFGWWSWHPRGPVQDINFRFPPGAVALHIHSFSAETIRDPYKNWVGPLVSRGVTATVGNVFEPYLELTHHPHLLFEALERGKSFGEAAYYSLPGLSWQAIVVGDPLYQPFLVELDEQLELLEEDETNSLGQYAVIRQMNQLMQRGRKQEAIDFGQGWLKRNGGVALAFRLARCQLEAGQQEGALQTLLGVSYEQGFEPADQPVALEIAEFLEREGARRSALVIYETLFGSSKLEPRLAPHALPMGIRLARRLDRQELVDAWERRLDNLRPIEEEPQP